MATVTWEKLGINNASCWAIPKNDFTSRMFLPSGLTTKNAGEHHSEGSWHGVMTPFADRVVPLLGRDLILEKKITEPS